MNVLIVDDEPLARQGLRRELAGVPGIVVSGEAGSRDDAVRAIVDRRPDLVLLDIQLGRHSAFEIIEQIGVEEMPLVIFVTAYDRHAIRAFEVNALDYVLKPVDPVRLREALDRAAGAHGAGPRRQTSRRAKALAAAGLAVAPTEPGPLERIVARDGDRLTFVDVAAVDWIEACGNYVQLHVGPRRYTVRTTMGALARRIAAGGSRDGQAFIRVRRSALVNVRAIHAVSRYSKGMYLVELRGGGRVISSRYHQTGLRALLARDESE